MQIKIIDILGIPIHSLYFRDIPKIVCEIIKKKEKCYFCVPPVNSILLARKDELLRTIYLNSKINFADSVPSIWASKILGNQIVERISGMDLFEKMLKITQSEAISHYLLGSSDEVLEKLNSKIKMNYPQLKLAGYYSPPYKKEFTEAEDFEMVKMINKCKPNILWVSLTCPKQEKWIYKNLKDLNINIAIGVGAAFDVSSGKVKRAPYWMQKNGLEWFYRFLQEPRRLFKRYFLEAPLFIPLVFIKKLKLMKK